MILIAGGETWYSASRARKNEIVLNYSKKKESKYEKGGFWMDLNEFEYSNRLFLTSISYAFFETALRAASGRNLEEHQLFIGRVFERFSKIASKHPDA